MTTGEYLASLSSSPSGSTALEVVANIEGTFPIWTPYDSFKVDFNQPILDSNLDIITISGDLSSNVLSGEIITDPLDTNITNEILNGDL